ncbi:MAG: glycerol-3-phosphate acyltransferase [Butyricicoccaceae bacterium]
MRIPTRPPERHSGRATRAYSRLPTRGPPSAHLLHAAQASTCPPTFVCFCNDARLFHFSYQRYLENQIREVFGLTGTPVRMVVARARRQGITVRCPKNEFWGKNVMTLDAFAIIAVCAYLLGSLSFAIIVSKLTLGKDIRNYGSGNAGLTSAYRTMGARKTLLVLLGDIAKGAAAVSIGMVLAGPVGKLTAGIFVILGHMFPLYFGFRGR